MRIQRLYKVESDFPSNIWHEDVLETENSLIDESDPLYSLFPQHPYKKLVKIICEAAPPLSPISNHIVHSTGAKRPRPLWSEESGGIERKRAKTCCSSSVPSSRKHSLDRRRLPHIGFDFASSVTSPEVAYVDKTYCILGLPARFQRLLLRPPLFGKTALLSTFAHYYDIHKAQTFSEDFGALAVTTTDAATALPPNQHLCLMFDFSQVLKPRSVNALVMGIRSMTTGALSQFVRNYAEELEVVKPTDYLVGIPKEALLGEVLGLVRQRNLTIFVGVDNYDAPIRRGLFPYPRSPAPLHGLATQTQLEALMEASFWKPLCDASDVVHKMFVTGTFPLNIPSLQACQLLDQVAPPGLSPCGFTETEALEFSRMVMDEPLDVAELRRSCGQYTFPHPTGFTEPVLHPNRLIGRICDVISDLNIDEASSLHYTFADLPQESDIAGAVTTNGLIDLMTTGAIDTDTPMGAPILLDGVTMTWNALYHLGAVTYDLHLPGILRIGNTTVLSMIHSAIDKAFAVRYDLHETFYQIWKKGDADVLVDLLTEALRDLTIQSFVKTHEPDLRGVFELILGNQLGGEPKCIMGPLELFSTTGLTSVKMRDPTDVRQVRHWELRTLTLRGLWRARNPNDEPTPESLRALHEELMKDEEEQLLERPYAVWSPSLGTVETVLVRSFIEAKPDTPLFLAVGGARVLIRL
ncbi:hypothetical protein DFH06DRAFT_1123793 [Mycena polygramma]|nr:hypothetical protein DFH06DRAFT_1123793 [Mycena polygramma]